MYSAFTSATSMTIKEGFYSQDFTTNKRNKILETQKFFHNIQTNSSQKYIPKVVNMFKISKKLNIFLQITSAALRKCAALVINIGCNPTSP